MKKIPPDQNTSLLTFPCDFTIKVFGANNDEFEATVLMLIHKHLPNLADSALQSRTSSGGKYCALSITVHVDSKEQINGIYQELTASPQVLMAL